ncbi:MAG: hypothetical protein LBO73_04625, partial [Holosporaceae bacterium]|nr:hypothetical protein [Holosporaceae bacterium]
MKKISLISAMLAFCPNLQAMQSYSYMQYPAERQLTPCLQAIPNQVYDWVFAAGVDLFHKVRAVMRLS